jgi:hypothetical protein
MPQLALILRHCHEQHQPLAIPVTLETGREQPPFSDIEILPPCRCEPPPYPPPGTPGNQPSHRGGPGDGLPGGPLIKTEQGKGVDDRLSPSGILCAVEQIVAKREEQVGASARPPRNVRPRPSSRLAPWHPVSMVPLAVAGHGMLDHADMMP